MSNLILRTEYHEASIDLEGLIWKEIYIALRFHIQTFSIPLPLPPPPISLWAIGNIYLDVSDLFIYLVKGI